MSNCFSCDFRAPSYQSGSRMVEPFLGLNLVVVTGYYFFNCAQPNATSASIQNVKTNLREFYVKRLKLDLCYRYVQHVGIEYMMVFVLNVPNNYNPSFVYDAFKFTDLPSHAIPENVLYYDLISLDSSTVDIKIDIKKPFRVSPSYKLAVVFYLYNRHADEIKTDGTAQVFFDVN